MKGTITALVGCQFPGCAVEVSYPLEMVRMLNHSPVCEQCYEGPIVELDNDGVPLVAWDDLPPVKLTDLKE